MEARAVHLSGPAHSSISTPSRRASSAACRTFIFMPFSSKESISRTRIPRDVRIGERHAPQARPEEFGPSPAHTARTPRARNGSRRRPHCASGIRQSAPCADAKRQNWQIRPCNGRTTDDSRSSRQGWSPSACSRRTPRDGNCIPADRRSKSRVAENDIRELRVPECASGEDAAGKATALHREVFADRVRRNPHRGIRRRRSPRRGASGWGRQPFQARQAVADGRFPYTKIV